MNHSTIRILILMLSLLALCSCNVGFHETSINVRHSDFEIAPATRIEVARSYEILHRWLADNGYKKLSSVESIDRATTWSGKTSVGDPLGFSEVYSKEISRAFPGSLFTVTVVDMESLKVFRVTLTLSVVGSRAEHVSQEGLVLNEQESFQKGLRTNPLKK